MADLELVKTLGDTPVHIIYLLGILVLWRQLLAVQEKYENLVREMGATLAILAKELEEQHDRKDAGRS